MCLFESHKDSVQGAIISTSLTGNISDFVQYLERMAMRDWQTQLQGANLAVLGLKYVRKRSVILICSSESICQK